MSHDLVLTWLAFAAAVTLAGIFAGAETGLYQFSPLRLRLGIQRRVVGFRILGVLMHDKSGLLLSLLIGTNLAHYLATSVITQAFLHRFGSAHTAELATTLMTAPILFVFSEMIPKNIFLYRADTLMPPLAHLLFATHRVLTWSGIVPLLKAVAGLFAKVASLTAPTQTALGTTQRHQIRTLLQDTHEEGILSPTQAEIINRIVGAPSMQVQALMTSLAEAVMLEVHSGAKAVLEQLQKCSCTRLPVYQERPEKVLGYVNVYEVLDVDEPFEDLSQFVKQFCSLDAETLVVEAVRRLRRDNQRMALIVRRGPGGTDKPVGIVTMGDLIEGLLINVT